MTTLLATLQTWMLARAPEPPRAANPALPVPRLSRATLAAVALAHAGLLAILLNAPATLESVAPPRPLMVSLIKPAAEMRQPEPKPLAPKPAPEVRPPEPKLQAPRPALKPLPPRVLAAQRPTPEPQPAAATPMPLPEVLPPPEAAPAPIAVAVQPAPSPPSQPRFNADYLTNPKPSYPLISRRMGEEGEVRLRVHVDTTGQAQQIEVFRSSGFPRLDQAALDTVKQWRFIPARQGDQPVAAWVIVPIQFSLRS